MIFIIIMVIIFLFLPAFLIAKILWNKRKERLKKKYETTKNTIIARSTFEKIKVLNEKVLPTGFAYESRQDIFYSVMNGWQKTFGYCRLYDEVAASMYMIIHCEPIYFYYKDKKWLIEFWKGQYGMTTGAEVGIYTTEGLDLNIGVFDATFYKSAEEEDFLSISMTLWKDGELLFTRSGWHWWLTGFVMGEFTEPKDLTLDVEIIMRDKEMMNAFIGGLRKAGYPDSEILIKNNIVKFTFSKPHTPQPLTQKSFIARLHQRRNRKNCELYHELTNEFSNTMDRIEYIQYRAPKLFTRLINIGKTKEFYQSYYKINNKKTNIKR